MEEIKQVGIYGWFPLPTGAVVGIVLIPIMVITALPIIRRNNYNTFYYIHIIFAILVLVLVCLHASTSFYFILPGLLLWIYDWSYRVQHALRFTQTVEVESAGNNWYRMRLPSTSKTFADDGSAAEKGLTSQDASEPIHPLETYYVRVSAISKVEIHPFTAVATATSLSGPLILFQKSPPKKKVSASDKEWTWLLGAMVDKSSMETALHMEVSNLMTGRRFFFQQ
jgi:ferric-chelate reductase